MSLRLEVLKDGDAVQEITLKPGGEAMVGRETDCAIRLNDRAISRKHAILRVVESGIQVERQSEFAPLSVNGEEVTRALIKLGDVIALGPYRLRLKGEPGIGDSRASEVMLQEQTSEEESQSIPAIPELEVVPTAEAIDSDTLSQLIEKKNLDEARQSNSEEGATRILSRAAVAAKLIVKSTQPEILSEEVLSFPEDSNEWFLGRAKECGVVLNDKKVSRQNTVIRRNGAQFTVEDLGSSNGTLVNGDKLSSGEVRALASGDRVRVGFTEFEFLAENQSYSEQISSVPEMDGIVIEGSGEGQSDESETPLQVDTGESPLEAPRVDTPPAPFSSTPGFTGFSNVPGIQSLKPGPKQKMTLMERYRALPPRSQLIYGIAFLALLWFLAEDDPVPQPPRRQQQKAARTADGKDPRAGKIKALNAEDRKFVEAQLERATQLFKNGDFDKCLFELGRLFEKIDDYKNARELERYAKEGKQRLIAIEEEKRKKEEEAKLKARLDGLLAEAGAFMKARKYEQAREKFAEILMVDPDNKFVEGWRNEIVARDEELRLEAEKKRVRDEINKRGWEVYNQAIELKDQGKLREAIRRLKEVAGVGASSKALKEKTETALDEIDDLLEQRRDPVLAQARESESRGEIQRAFALYRQVVKIDPDYKPAYDGINRLREQIVDRAKVLYTEAILAENFSDFATARKKYEELLRFAPDDDLYYARAKRKLASYNRHTGSTEFQNVPGGSSPSNGTPPATTDGAPAP